MSSIVKYLIVIFSFLFPFFINAQETNLYISEIMARPEDDTEWVEIYNPTTVSVSLEGWKVKDGNTQSSDDLTLSGNIEPLQFKTFDHPKGWLNDSSDETVNLLQNDSTVDSYSYKTASLGKTFSKIDGNWTADTTPSKGSANISPSPSQTPSMSPTPSPISQPSPTSQPSNTPTPSINTKPTFTISNIPQEISSSDIVTVSIQITDQSSTNTVFFLKPAFKKIDSSNYFGLTKVGDEWIKNSDSYNKNIKVTTDRHGNWSGKIEFKVDPFDSGYSGGGKYLLKVVKYTEDGTGPAWSNEHALNIIAKEIETEEGTDSENFIIPSYKYSPVPSEKTIPIPEIPKEVYSLENYKIKIATLSSIASVSGVATKSGDTNYQLSYKQIEWTPILLGGVFIAIGLVVYFRIKLGNHEQ